MSKISDFTDKLKTHFDAIDTGLDGLTGDIEDLNDLVAKLQATQGEITAEDQALLDQIEARGLAAADRLTALDALTPPVVPANP